MIYVSLNMGRTYRRDEGRRPKWDKRNNNKSHKVREYEEEKFKYRPQNLPPPESIEPDEPMT